MNLRVRSVTASAMIAVLMEGSWKRVISIFSIQLWAACAGANKSWHQLRPRLVLYLSDLDDTFYNSSTQVRNIEREARVTYGGEDMAQNIPPDTLEVLHRFRRQYLQMLEPTALSWPDARALRSIAVQSWLYARCFDAAGNRYGPSGRYQLRVLKQLVLMIEATVKDSEEDVGSPSSNLFINPRTLFPRLHSSSVPSCSFPVFLPDHEWP